MALFSWQYHSLLPGNVAMDELTCRVYDLDSGEVILAARSLLAQGLDPLRARRVAQAPCIL